MQTANNQNPSQVSPAPTQSSGEAVQPPSSASNNAPAQGENRRPIRKNLTLGILGSLAIIILLSVIGWNYWSNKSTKQKPSPSPTPAPDYSAPKEGTPLAAVNGKILDIKKIGSKSVFDVTSYSTPWQKQWAVVIGENTLLLNKSDWQTNSFASFLLTPVAQGLSFEDAQKKWKASLKLLSPQDFKIGNVVYIQAASGQDFMKDTNINGPSVIVLMGS